MMSEIDHRKYIRRVVIGGLAGIILVGAGVLGLNKAGKYYGLSVEHKKLSKDKKHVFYKTKSIKYGLPSYLGLCAGISTLGVSFLLDDESIHKINLEKK